jgi:hypothetical protein
MAASVWFACWGAGPQSLSPACRANVSTARARTGRSRASNARSSSSSCCQIDRRTECHLDNGIEIRQVEHHRGRSTFDLRTRLLTFLQRSRCADDVRAAKREHTHCFQTDAGVAAGDHSGLAAEIQTGCDFFSGRSAAGTCRRSIRPHRHLQAQRQEFTTLHARSAFS